jgi:hypothetical protein
MKKSHMVGLLLLLLGLTHCAKDNTMKFMKIRELKTNEIILSLYLGEMTEKLGCHFTFEILNANDHASLINARSAIGVPEDPSVTNVNLLISKLRHDLPGCLVMQSKNNPRILHIIEAPLTKLKDYALEKKVDITYSGILGSGTGPGLGLGPGVSQGLALELSKKLDGIGPRTRGDNTTAFEDTLTKVNVKAKNEKVRDILTDCVPLTNYGSFLWIAETVKVGAKTETIVQYFGPKRNQ